MPEVVKWRLPRASGETVLQLRVAAGPSFPYKAFVATIEGCDARRFAADNIRWKFSSTLGLPFLYVPEISEAPTLVALDTITLPGADKVLLGVRPWAGNRQAPSSVFQTLLASQAGSTGRTITTYVEGETYR